MRIDVKVFIIFLILVPTVFCFLLKITWAVPASYQEIQNLKESEQIERPIVIIKVPRVEYNATNLRDPFEAEPVGEEEEEEGEEQQPIWTQPQAPLPELNVQGIVWGADLPQAIINNQVVKIGDRIEGVRIVDITKEGITVFFGGRQQLIAAPAVNMLEEQIPNSKGGTDETED